MLAVITSVNTKDYDSAKAASPTKTKERILNSMSQVKKFAGYSSCSCSVEFSSGIVLDPFMGSGTTALVALKNNRRFIGIELQPDYVKMAYSRIQHLLDQVKLDKYLA